MDEAQIKALMEGMMAQFQTKLDAITTSLKPAPAPAPAPVPAPAPAPVAAPAIDPVLNSQMLDLKRSNEKLVADMAAIQKAREEADKRADESERMSVINTALGGFQFATDAARQTAVEKVLPQIKRTDTGALIAGDNLTPEAFIKDYLPSQHAYLLAPVATGGSGMVPGARGIQSAAVDIQSIKPGMTPEARAAAVAAIQLAGADIFPRR